MMHFEIFQGRKLPKSYIQRMVKQRIQEYGENTKDFEKNEQNSFFIFLWEHDVLKAFGMLKPLRLTYLEEVYNVRGIGNIIAIEKGQGYGKLLMTELRSYLDSQKRVGLGFCDPENTGFYRKCGYTVVEDISTRFRYLHAQETGNRERLDDAPDVLCSSPEFIDLLQSTEEPIYVSVPFW